MKDAIVREVQAIAAGILGVSATTIHEVSNLRELPGVESIKMLQIIAKVERKYGVELQDEIIFSISTIDELATKIEAQLREAAAAP